MRSAESASKDRRRILGNRIGLQARFNKALPNGYGISLSGDFLNGASENVIGGTEPGEGNVIAFNRHDGVRLPPRWKEVRWQDRRRCAATPSLRMAASGST